MKSALVCGWGAVERTSTTWHPEARVVEVEVRLWHVFVGDVPIGVIGKEPWTREELARRAAALDPT